MPKDRNKNKPSEYFDASSFQIPDAAVLAEERQQQSKQDNIVDTIIRNMNLKFNFQENSTVDVLSAVDYDINKKFKEMMGDRRNSREQSPDIFDNGVIKIDMKDSKIRALNPGIKIDDLNFDSLGYEMSKPQIKFMNTVLEMIKTCNNEMLDDMLTTLVFEIQDMVTNDLSENLSEKELLAYALLLLIISFDVRCRTITILINKQKVFWEIIKKISSMNTPETLTLFTEKILQIFKHFHDRFCVAEYICCGNFNPILIENSMYLNIKLSRYILYHTLCDIIKYEQNARINIDNFNTLYNLKRMFRKSKSLNSLEYYEQYILIKIVFTLKRMLHEVNDSEHLKNEKKAEKWLVDYFNELKPKNSQQKAINPDYLKVKALCSCAKLLWTDQKETNMKEKK